jgi:hypothetical protein
MDSNLQVKERIQKKELRALMVSSNIDFFLYFLETSLKNLINFFLDQCFREGASSFLLILSWTVIACGGDLNL